MNSLPIFSVIQFYTPFTTWRVTYVRTVCLSVAPYLVRSEGLQHDEFLERIDIVVPRSGQWLLMRVVGVEHGLP